MTTKEEMIWLYRCILGRDPETEATLIGMSERFADFQQARIEIMRCRESVMKQRNDTPALRINREKSGLDLAHFVDDELAGGYGFNNPIEMEKLPAQDVRATLPLAVYNEIARRLPLRTVLIFGDLADHAWLLSAIATKPEEHGAATIISVPNRGITDSGNQPAHACFGQTCNLLLGSTPVLHVRMTIGWSAMFSLLSTLGIEPNLIIVDHLAGITARQITRDSFDFVHERGLMLTRFNHGNAEEVENEIRALLRDELRRNEISAGSYFVVHKWEWFLPLVVPQAHIWNPAQSEEKFEFPQLPAKLAIACIVKNEEPYLGTMLRSCIPIAAYFLIVDTGSTDGTQEAARQVLSASGVPFEIVETSFVDFASARNVAVDKVPPWIDWVLMLDADEYLVVEEYPLFVNLLQHDYEGWELPRYNYYDAERKITPTPYPDRQTRLFRNLPDRRIRYFGAVHECLVGARSMGIAPINLQAVGLGEGGPHIHHMGHVVRTKEEERKKLALYESLSQVLNTRS